MSLVRGMCLPAAVGCGFRGLAGASSAWSWLDVLCSLCAEGAVTCWPALPPAPRRRQPCFLCSPPAALRLPSECRDEQPACLMDSFWKEGALSGQPACRGSWEAAPAPCCSRWPPGDPPEMVGSPGPLPGCRAVRAGPRELPVIFSSPAAGKGGTGIPSGVWKASLSAYLGKTWSSQIIPG